MTNEQFVDAQRIKGEIYHLVNAKITYDKYVKVHTSPKLSKEFPFLDKLIKKNEAALRKEFMEHIDELIENLQNQFEEL